MFVTRRPITVGFGMLALVGSLMGMAASPDGGQLYLRHCAVCHGPAILVAESPYSLREAVEGVRRAVTGKNFRLIGER
jgi:mono/diheme cytochrome c family protein